MKTKTVKKNKLSLEVLVATMNQDDFSKLKSMNIHTNAIFANQCDKNGFAEFSSNEYNAKMISTTTRGVGLNRNIALLASSADILLFSDDDMYYYDGKLDGVIQAFEDNPQADVIIFSFDILKNGKIEKQIRLNNQRARVWNSMKFGAIAVAIRRNSLLQSNLKFNELFGGGCMYSAGEDSLFIKSCFDNHLKVYTSSYVLGSTCQDSSTWFEGYSDKFFYDKGVLLGCLFPKMKYLFLFHFLFRFKRQTDKSLTKCFKLMARGIREAKQMKSFGE